MNLDRKKRVRQQRAYLLVFLPKAHVARFSKFLFKSLILGPIVTGEINALFLDYDPKVNLQDGFFFFCLHPQMLASLPPSLPLFLLRTFIDHLLYAEHNAR